VQITCYNVMSFMSRSTYKMPPFIFFIRSDTDVNCLRLIFSDAMQAACVKALLTVGEFTEDVDDVGLFKHQFVRFSRLIASHCLHFWTVCTDSHLSPNQSTNQPLASPAMGHWGTCPPRLPASYFGDHPLYRL